MAAHADTDDGELADLLIGNHLVKTDLGFEPVDDFAGLEQIGFINGKAQVGGGLAGTVADVLDNHVHVDGGIADGLEDAGGDAGLVRHGNEGDLGLVFIECDAADDDVFHVFGFFFHNGSWVVVQAGTNFKDDAEFFGELDGAGLHDFGAEAGEFEHLVIRNFIELARVGDDAGVGGVNAINVRVNLAKVSLERGGKGDRGEVGAAAAKSGNVAGRSLALKTGNDDDIAGVKQGVDLFGFDCLDFGLGVDIVRQNTGLRTGEGDGGDIERKEGHGGEGDGGLVARGQEHVHLALAGQGHDFFGELDEIIGDAAHGGDDDDDLVAFGAVARDAAGDVFNALRVADRSTAVFLDDQSHNFPAHAAKLPVGPNGRWKVAESSSLKRRN